MRKQYVILTKTYSYTYGVSDTYKIFKSWEKLVDHIKEYGQQENVYVLGEQVKPVLEVKEIK